MDSDSSYINDDFQYIYFKNNIYLLFLPVYSSHIFQPLDLSIFSALKTVYRRYLEQFATFLDSISIDKLNFLRYYKKVRCNVFILKNIKSNFKVIRI